MLAFLRALAKNIPTLLLALALAVAVWISAVTASDPTEQRPYSRPVNVEIVGQGTGLVMTSTPPGAVTVTISAPQSVWNTQLASGSPVRAVVDLSGLGPGTHPVPVQVQFNVRLVRSYTWQPRTVDVTLEALSSQTFDVRLVMRGEPAVGYVASNPILSETKATVSGAASLIARVKEVQAVLDMSQVSETVSRSLTLIAVDDSGQTVPGVAISPQQVTANSTISNRGGYRNVVVKVASAGRIASGYRLTNISVFPPTVTVFSTNPQIVNDLPGYVETASLDLTGARDDLDVRLPLELPPGVSVVGDQTVNVQVGIAAIESSLTLSAMPVEVIGLPEGQTAKVSPETIDVIVSGPLPLLDRLAKSDVRVIIEINGEGAGTYQRVPRIELNQTEIRVESILPGTVEVTITGVPKTSPTPKP